MMYFQYNFIIKFCSVKFLFIYGLINGLESYLLILVFNCALLLNTQLYVNGNNSGTFTFISQKHLNPNRLKAKGGISPHM